MHAWRSMVKRGVMLLLAGGLFSACYAPPPYYGYGYGRGYHCRRVWVAPYYGRAGYWRCA